MSHDVPIAFKQVILLTLLWRKENGHASIVVVVQSLSHVQLSVTSWVVACHTSPIFIISEVGQTHVHWVHWFEIKSSDPLLPSSPPELFLYQCRIFFNESALCIRWPKYWRFSFSLTPSSEYSGLISFGNDWFDLFDVQRTLKSLLQHRSLNASIIWCSIFSQLVQLSHSYMTTGQTIALTRQIFVGKVMPLLFNMLPRLVIAFISRIKYLLISWLLLPYAVFLEPKKLNPGTVSIFFPSICYKVMGQWS